MATPTFTLPTSGSDPRRATKEWLEENLNQIIEYLDNARIRGDAAQTTGLNFQGPWDASTELFPSENLDGDPVERGDFFWVSAEGTFGGDTYSVNEPLVAVVDNPSTTDVSDWYHAPVNPSLVPLISRIDPMAYSFKDKAALEADTTTLAAYQGEKGTSGVAFARTNELDRDYHLSLSGSDLSGPSVTSAGGVKFFRRDLLDREVTVGAGGQFSNIGEALTEIANQPRGYRYPSAELTIRLLTGFELDEQVIAINGQNLMDIKIVSDDVVVNASRSSLVLSSTSIPELDAVEPAKAYFMAGNFASLPRIGCVFQMDTDGAENSLNTGLFVTRGAQGLIETGGGFWDTDGNGAVAYHGAKIVANDTVWERNGRAKASTGSDLSAIRGAFQSIISATDAAITDSNDCGILAIGATIATFRNTAITNAARHGLYPGSVANIHARGMTITGCGGAGLYASEGSQTRLIQSTITGNASNGIFILENSVVNSATGTTISNNGGYGVRATDGSRFSISSPTVENNALGGVIADSADIFISSGDVKNNTGDDLNVSAGGTIRLAGTVETTNGTSADNNIADSNVAAMNVWSSSANGGAIYGRGGKSAARGTKSISSGSTSVTVSHGVGFTPLIAEVSVTPTNSLNSASKFWVSNMTSTTFDINVDVDPAAGGASFVWQVARIIT